MDLPELRIAILNRRHLYGGGRDLPRGFRFLRYPRSKPHRIRSCSRKLHKALQRHFLSFALRHGFNRISFTGAAAYSSAQRRTSSHRRVTSLTEAAKQGLLFGRSTKLEALLLRIVRNHSRFDYRKLLASFFPHPSTTTVSPLRAADVLRYLRRCIREVVPPGFFGSQGNFDKFVVRILPLFIGHKSDQLSMASILGGLDSSEMKDQSSAGKGDGIFGMSFIISIGWLISTYVTPLLASFFYITETRESHGRMEVFLKNPYLAGCSREVRRLVRENMLEPIPFEGYSALYFNVDLRFLPKSDGGWRMLCVFPKSDTESRARMTGLKKRVNPILQKARMVSPDVISSTEDQICCSWLNAVFKARLQKKKLYFVKMDVAGAYPNMKPDILREALNRLLAPVNHSAGLIIDVERTCVRWGSKWYRFKKGIPQGSFPMSTLLCDLYYAHVLSTVLSDFRRENLREDEVFVRYLDDILFASTDKARVRRFVEQAENAAFSPAGVVFNTSKSITNVEGLGRTLHRLCKSVIFCGSRFDPNTPVIRPVSIDEHAVYVRCPLFMYLQSRSIVMSSRIRWKWHLRDVESKYQKPMLIKACRAGFRTFLRIVTKTSVVCFGSESAIWLKYPEVVAGHFKRIIRHAVKLYVKNSTGARGALTAFEVGNIAVDSLVKVLTTGNRHYTSSVLKLIRRMKHEGILLPAFAKRWKSDIVAAKPPTQWRRFGWAQSMIKRENGPPSGTEVSELPTSAFIVHPFGDATGKRWTCLLCDSKLKSASDYQKHLNGKLHRERFAALSTGSGNVNSSSEAERFRMWDERFTRLDQELRCDAESALRQTAAASKIIQMVSTALRWFSSTPEGLKYRATKIVRLGALAEPYWEKSGSRLGCAIHLQSPWDVEKLDQFVTFFEKRVSSGASGKGYKIKRISRQDRFDVGCHLDGRYTHVMFILATNNAGDAVLGKNGNHLFIARQKWLDKNEKFVLDSNGAVISTTAIVRMLCHLTARDTAWAGLRKWHWNLLAIWAVKREERVLRLGEAVRMFFAYVAARFHRSSTVVLRDPLQNKPIVAGSSHVLSESAQKFVDLIDAGDVETILARKPKGENKRKAEAEAGATTIPKRSRFATFVP